MRAFQALAALTALLAATPTFAAQITQSLPAVQDLGDFTPFNITGARFDPGLGTLASVTGELTGTVTANTFLPLGPFLTTRQTTTYFVFTPAGTSPGPNVFSGSLADQTVTPTGGADGTNGRYQGSPAAVDLTFNFGDPSEFIGSPTPPALLAEFGFRAGLPDRTGSFSGASDETTFNGVMRLTYTYDAAAVPEPGSLALLGGGIAGVLALRRRRAAGLRAAAPR